MSYHKKIAELEKAGFITESEAIELTKEADATADIVRALAPDIIKEGKINIGDALKWIGNSKFELSLGLGAIPALVTGSEIVKNKIDRKRMYNVLLKEYPQLREKYTDRELRNAYNVVADYMPNLLKNPVVLAGAVRQIANANNQEVEPGVDPAVVGSMVSDANMIGSGTPFYSRNTAPKVRKMIGESVVGTSYPIEMQSREILGKYQQFKQVAKAMEKQITDIDTVLNNPDTPDIQKPILEGQKQELVNRLIPIKQMLQEIEQSGAEGQAQAQINMAKAMQSFGQNIASGNIFSGLNTGQENAVGNKANPGNGHGGARH